MKRGFVFYVVLFLALLPAAYGATITEIDIYTCATNSSVYPLISGSWGRAHAGAIGITAATDGTSPFLDPLGVMNLPSGSYLLLLGWEDRFKNNALPDDVLTAAVTVHYSDQTLKTAWFLNDVMTAPSIWTRLTGNSSLVLGSSGILNVDRIGNSVVGGPMNPNGRYDAILEFSDTGSFRSQVPEPATAVLIGAGLILVGLLKRKLA